MGERSSGPGKGRGFGVCFPLGDRILPSPLWFVGRGASAQLCAEVPAAQRRAKGFLYFCFNCYYSFFFGFFFLSFFFLSFSPPPLFLKGFCEIKVRCE